MSSPPFSLLNWFLFILLMAVTVMALWAFYFWWKKNRYTLEKFAFFGFSALMGFSIYLIGSFSLNTSVFGGLVKIALMPFGVEIPLNQLTPIEAVFVVLIFFGMIYTYIQVFKDWKGQKSIAQHEQIQNRETAHILTAILLFLRRDEKIAPYNELAHQK